MHSKVQRAQIYKNVLGKEGIDEDVVSRRAMMGIICRNFTDEQVEAGVWNEQKPMIARSIHESAFGDGDYAKKVTIEAR